MIAYAPCIDAAEDLCVKIKEAACVCGVEVHVDRVTSGEGGVDLDDAIRRFKARPTEWELSENQTTRSARYFRPILSVLVSCQMLNAGVDVPPCDSVLIAKPPDIRSFRGAREMIRGYLDAAVRNGVQRQTGMHRLRVQSGHRAG